MSLITSYYGDSIQVALAALTIILVIVSIKAYRKRPEGRYLLLVLAFISLCVISVSTLALEFFVGGGPTIIPFVELYLIPSLELLMVISFLAALAWSPRVKKRVILIFLVVNITIGVAVSTAYLSGAGNNNNNYIQSVLAAGCVKPVGGFLIIASSLGYNDSMMHGAPTKSWPMLDVSKGSNVTITICNMYSQAVGFQVARYLESKTETVLPNHAIKVSFVANQTGSFPIYCTTFSAIHIYLQGGEVNVI